MQLLEVMHAMENAMSTTASFEDAMRSSIHCLLTQQTSSADLSALSITEGHRMVIGTVPLSNPAEGSITVMVPRGKSATSSLQEETRWTKPPTLVTNPDHGFAASQSSIPSSVIDWRTKKIESFGMSSVDANGNMVGGVVSNDGFSMPVVHNLTTGAVRGLGGQFRGSTDITISADGSRAATSTYGTGRNGTMRVWDTATGAQIGETERPEYVSQMAFRPGDTPDLFYSTEYGHYVSWNKVNGDGGRIFEEVWPRFTVSESVAAAPRIVDLGRGRFGPGDTVELYDLLQERKLPALSTGATVRDLAISPDGTVLLTWDRGGVVHIWNITTQQKIATITPTAGTRDARAQFGNDGSLIIITDNTGKLREFSVDSLRNGNTEPLVQRTYDTRDSILVHPSAPGYIASRTDKGSVSLRASGLPAIVTNGEQVPAVEGKGDGTVWLDYSTVNHLVTQGQFRITGAPAGTQFTVTSFMGTQRLASQSASAGDLVSVSNAEGISAVAVQGVGWNGPVALAQMDVSTLESAPAADSTELGLLSNDLFAKTWADTDEVWGDKWLDYRSQMAAVEGDTMLPMLVRATGGTLYGFTYHTNVHRDRQGNAKSLARSALPESAFIRIDASTVILLPGYPAALYVNVGDGTIVGTRKGQNGGIILEKEQSANILDLVPKEGMDVRVDWLDTVSAGEGTREGFFREALTPGVTSHRSPEGGSIETTMRVQNSGSSGGTIRAEIYPIHRPIAFSKKPSKDISAHRISSHCASARMPLPATVQPMPT
jgi:WD40 repeat protein